MAGFFTDFSESLKSVATQTLATAQQQATAAATNAAQNAVDRAFVATGLQRQVAPQVGEAARQTIASPPPAGQDNSPKANDGTALKEQRTAVTGAEVKAWLPWAIAGAAGLVVLVLVMKGK